MTLIKIPEADSLSCKQLYMDPSSKRSKGWNFVICKEVLLVSLWRHCWMILLCMRWIGLSSWEDGTRSDQVVVILSSTTFTNKAIWVFLHIILYLWILCWYMHLYGQYISNPILFTVKDLYALMVSCCCESTGVLWSGEVRKWLWDSVKWERKQARSQVEDWGWYSLLLSHLSLVKEKPVTLIYLFLR